MGIFLLLSASIAATWYSATTAQEAAVIRERGRELQAIAELKIGFIHFWLEERRADAAVQGKMPLMARTAEHGAPRTGPDSADVVRDRLEVFREAYGYEAILLLDRTARYRAWAGPAEEYVYPPASDPARAAMESGRTVVSRAYRSKVNERHHPDIDIATPVFAGSRDRWRIVGVLVFHLDPLQHLDPMLQQWPAPSASGETFLVEYSGDEVTFLSTLRHADAALLRKSAAEGSLPAAIAVRGGRGVTEGLDYRGVPVLAAVGQVPDMPWYVVAKIDRDEILAPARREARRSGAFAVLLVLALGLATLSWHRRGQSELALAQQAATKAALAASEARFRKLHEHGWDFNALFDRNMVIRYASPSIDRYLGRKATGELIGAGTARVILTTWRLSRRRGRPRWNSREHRNS